MKRVDLLTHIIADIQTPMTMPQILSAVPSVDPMKASIAVMKAVLAGDLLTEQSRFGTHWPIYFRGKPQPSVNYWHEQNKRRMVESKL